MSRQHGYNRTDLRSYAGEQGVPFRYPREERRRKPEPMRFWQALVWVCLFYAAGAAALVLLFRFLGGAS